MNAPAVLAPDGQLRRAFTVSDVERMVEAGVIGPEERIEIIDGELLPMSPKGIAHETLRIDLQTHFGDTRPREVRVASEPGWKLADDTYLEPDFLFFSANRKFSDVRAEDALLVIEISHSTLSFDLGRKAQVYADLGVRELWVIDAIERQVYVHLQPGKGGYGAVRGYGPDVRLEADASVEISLRLSDFPAG